MDDKYVILDIDSTILFSSPANILEKCSSENRCFYIQPEERNELFKVKIRNHFSKFINELLEKKYKLIVWSAGSESYVKKIVSFMFIKYKLEYVFTQNHLIDDRKDLSVIEKYIDGFKKENSRLVDDNRMHEKKQEKSFVYIKPFFGSEDDNILENFSKEVEKSFNT